MDLTEDLRSKIAELEKLVKVLQKNELLRLEEEYKLTRSLLEDAIFSSKEIENEFEFTLKQLELSDFLNELIAANNPCNDSLGFNLVETINKNVEATLMQDIEKIEGAKPRLLEIISKVVNNPIADILLKSNPVGAIVSNVMNAASNFIDTNILTEKPRKFITKVRTETKSVISKEKLKQFQQAMEKYISLYASLLTSTKNFNDKLDYLRFKNAELAVSLKDYHNEYLKSLGLDSANGHLITRFNAIFDEKDVDGSIDYVKVLKKPEVINARKIAGYSPSYRKDVDLFVKDFTDSLRNFLTEYQKILESVLISWTDQDINKEDLGKLIKRVAEFKKNATSQIIQPGIGEPLLDLNN